MYSIDLRQNFFDAYQRNIDPQARQRLQQWQQTLPNSYPGNGASTVSTDRDQRPKNNRRNVTVLGAYSCDGIEAVMTIDGAVHSAVFRANVVQVLMQTLGMCDIAFMDNLRAHKVDGIRQAIEAARATFLDVPPIHRIGHHRALLVKIEDGIGRRQSTHPRSAG